MFNRYVINLQRDRARLLLDAIYGSSTTYEKAYSDPEPNYLKLMCAAMFLHMHHKFLHLYKTLDYTQKPKLRFSFTRSEAFAILLMCESLMEKESVSSNPFNASTFREIAEGLNKVLKNKPEFYS